MRKDHLNTPTEGVPAGTRRWKRNAFSFGHEVRQASAPDLTWGDTARVKADEPTAHRPGASASVVGFREDPEEPAAMLLIIEFDDGSSVEVPERSVDSLR
jgi:hypothetical protein